MSILPHILQSLIQTTCLVLQQKSLKEYAFVFLNFKQFPGKEIPKILAAIQGSANLHVNYN